jgi:hypothetical protein
MDVREANLDVAASDEGRVWDAFCDALKAAKAEVLRPAASSDPVSRAEGWRHLTRLLRISLDMHLENADPDFPAFYQAAHPTAKFGADSPDNCYHNATILGDRDYRITGRLGEAEHFSIGTKANRYATDGTMASTGEINGKDIEAGADGRFEVILSQRPQPKNWLPLAPDSSMVLVREMFRDWRTDRRAELRIERIGGPATPTPWTPETIERALQATTQFVRGSAKTFGDWAELFKNKPNYLDGGLQHLSQKGGGDPAIFYLHGYWKLAPDEALLIESEVPECLFWNFQLNNWWMESLDYRYGQISVNKFQARYEPDGRVRIVVAARDPGFGNFIDTLGHTEGTMTGRWVHADNHPIPTCKVVKIDELKG